MSFLEDLGSVSILRQAWERVAAKRGVAGIDRVGIAQFGARLDAELERLAEEIGSRSYRPLPVLRIRPSFLGSSDRALVVPAVRDRVVQRAVFDLLVPAVDATLSPACRAFRKGSSAIAAADDVSRWIEAGERWVLRADVKSFFDTIQPQRLAEKLSPFVDAEGLRFLDRILRCRVFDHDQVVEAVEGIAQGSPLSPLLGNLYLNEVDAAVLASHPHYLRYCDDLIVLAAGEAEVRAAREQVAGLLADLALALNEEKTRVCRAEDGFVFLGYHFGAAGRGPAAKAVEALHFRFKELSDAEIVEVSEVDALYRGWTGYFGHHPECWTVSPLGLLALLRAPGVAGGEGAVERLVAARWKLTSEPTPSLALALARAWRQAGREEQAWLELAAICGGSRTGNAALAEWSEVLAVPVEDLAVLTRPLAGTMAGRVSALAEALAGLGRFEAASRLAGVVAAERAPAEAGAVVDDLASAADYRLLLELFEGREGIHAVEAVGRSGHRTFVPVPRPLAAEDWRTHLRGERTLALALMRAGNTALLGVLDIDIERRAIAEHGGFPDQLLGRALGAALRLRLELTRRGCSSLLEFSGQRGYHLWVRFAEPVPCLDLRRWLLDVVSAAGALPEGIRVEEFPNRDRVRPESCGPVIKLPLGVHSKTGKRCDLLDERGLPLPDPFESLHGLARLPAAAIRRPDPDAGPPPGGPLPGVPERRIGERAERMLTGCHVLAYLARRAQETRYLNHRERSSLLCALGHLGEEGTAALHAIISHTYNYRPEVTARHIGRLPPFPISCPRLRELHPEAAAFGVCRCKFDLHGRGYPTPLLLALKPAQVPAFRAGRGDAAGRPTREEQSERSREESPGPRRAAAVSNLGEQAEEKLAKLAELRRHQRGIETSMSRVRRELGELFDAGGSDVFELPLGRLRRVRHEGRDEWDFVIEV
jgi:RNA-directed DNA polymerase